MFAERDLDVVEVEEGVLETTSATGNSFIGSVEGADFSVTSNQTMSGGALARTDVTVGQAMGEQSVLTTAATGNTGDAAVSQGTMTGVFNQRNDGSGIVARSWIEGQNARADNLQSSTNAIGNSQGVGLTNGSVGARIAQQNEADVSAEGGVVLQYMPGQATISAAAAGNNATSVGVDQSAQRVIVSQNNVGASTNAEADAYYGNSYLTTTSATASGNNANLTNQGPLLDVTSTQNNEAAVTADAYASSYDFGGASVLSYGVGNSAMAGNAGEELAFSNTQNNEGGVLSVAGFDGHNGYDSFASATAMGNAVTGYSCAYCAGTMSIGNQQTNSANVIAQSRTTLTGQARSVIGLTTAVGNNASFYVTRPQE